MTTNAERDERIKVLENALSLLSDDATEADKALVRGELQVLTEQRESQRANAQGMIDVIQSEVDLVKPLKVLLDFAVQPRSRIGIDPRTQAEDDKVLGALRRIVNAYNNPRAMEIHHIKTAAGIA